MMRQPCPLPGPEAASAPVPARWGRRPLRDPVQAGSRAAGTDHRAAQLDDLEEQLAKQPSEVRTERDELAVADASLNG